MVALSCLPPDDEQRKFSRAKLELIAANQLDYLHKGLFTKPRREAFMNRSFDRSPTMNAGIGCSPGL